jgi:hypothetical protein
MNAASLRDTKPVSFVVADFVAVAAVGAGSGKTVMRTASPGARYGEQRPEPLRCDGAQTFGGVQLTLQLIRFALRQSDNAQPPPLVLSVLAMVSSKGARRAASDRPKAAS